MKLFYWIIICMANFAFAQESMESTEPNLYNHAPGIMIFLFIFPIVALAIAISVIIVDKTKKKYNPYMKLYEINYMLWQKKIHNAVENNDIEKFCQLYFGYIEYQLNISNYNQVERHCMQSLIDKSITCGNFEMTHLMWRLGFNFTIDNLRPAIITGKHELIYMVSRHVKCTKEEWKKIINEGDFGEIPLERLELLQPLSSY